MSAIKNQSLQLAQEEAYRLWAYCGAQYLENDAMKKQVSLYILRSISVFALCSRRVMESLDKTQKFRIDASPWSKGSLPVDMEMDLWKSNNLVIHANNIQIQFSTLTQGTYIADAKVVSHAIVSTDQKPELSISPFGMAYAFLAHVVPAYERKVFGS